MSAYGAVAVTNRPIDPLPPTTWDLPQPAPGKPAAPFRRLALHHLNLESARALPADSTDPGLNLLEYTYRVFAAEVEAGRTYPQETDALAAVIGASAGGAGTGAGAGDDTHATHVATRAYTRAAFEAYFWAADVIVAVGQTDYDTADDGGSGDGGQVRAQARNVGSGDLLEISRGGRSWENALVGFYYVKPNYPGRSSHVGVFSPIPFTITISSLHSSQNLVRSRSHTRWDWVDLQRRFYNPPCSPGIRIWKDFGQVVLALWSCARIQSKRFQSGLRK